MSNDIRPVSGLESVAICWGVAALAGFGAMILLYLTGDWTPLQAIFGGGVIGFSLGVILSLTVGRAKSGKDEKKAKVRPDPAALAARVNAPSPSKPPLTPAPSPHRTSIEASPLSDVKGPDLNDPAVNTALGGSTGKVNQAATRSAPVDGAASASRSAAAETAAAPAIGAAVIEDETGHAAPKAEMSAASTKPAEKPAETPAAKPAADEDADAGTEPTRLNGPRDGQADDLKMIKGVGPKLEGVLNDMGFYHFDQIAAWSDAEVAWADQNLVGFKGRVSRDNWVEQAKLLAEGGETEFSKKVGKGGVYN